MRMTTSYGRDSRRSHGLSLPNSAKLVVELTAREGEIVQELSHSATNREIAAKFVISENTVKSHVRNVLGKLQLNSRREVALDPCTRFAASANTGHLA